MPRLTPTRKTIANIITKQLGLEPGENLIIVFEEETGAVATLLDEVARDLAIRTLMIFAPRQMQAATRMGDGLPTTVTAAIQQANAMITCVNDSSECMLYRSLLLDTQNPDIAIGHTPGISVSMVSECFPQSHAAIEKKCDFLALPLAMSKKICITTREKDGTAHELYADINAWERLPIISNGYIPEGSWGNLLPGEVYIAPEQDTAKGSIVINASVPGRILEEDLILYFSRGRIKDIRTSSENTLDYFQATTQKVAEKNRDHNWDILAEIGIGVNENIKEVTGKPIIDEKIYGTVHIAIGENTGMGGTNESSIHYDMTTYSPDISVDDRPLMQQGKIVGDPSSWKEGFADIEADQRLRQAAVMVRVARGYSATSDGKLKKICVNGAQRRMEFVLGDDNLSALSLRILDELAKNEVDRVEIKKLAGRLGTDENKVRKALSFLLKHQLLDIPENGE